MNSWLSKVWDLRSMEREAKVLDIDQAAGVIMVRRWTEEVRMEV